MNPPATLSVIIPAWNAAPYLADAIASIRAQTWPVTEIIIVDDGSQDGTADVARSLGADLQLICQDNRGPAAARNRGLAAATGDFVTFLDADDLYVPEKVAWEMTALLADPTLEMALTFMQLFTDEPDGSRTWMRSPHFIFGFACGTYRRQAFAPPHGQIDETLRFGEDTDWFLRCCEREAHVQLIAQTGLLYRRHPASITWGKNGQEKGMLQILKRTLDRRRQAGSAGAGSAPLAWAQLFTGIRPPAPPAP